MVQGNYQLSSMYSQWGILENGIFNDRGCIFVHVNWNVIIIGMSLDVLDHVTAITDIKCPSVIRSEYQLTLVLPDLLPLYIAAIKYRLKHIYLLNPDV